MELSENCESDESEEFKEYAHGRLLWNWALVILYTVLNIEKVAYGYRLATLVVFLLSVLYLLIKVFDKRDQLKTTIWLAFITISSTLLLILHTLELIEDVILSSFITGIIILASICWCFVSHLKQVTDAYWHWYIWSLSMIVIICIVTSTLNIKEKTSIWIFVSLIIFVILLHIFYIYNLRVTNAQNLKCVRSIIWVVSSGIVSLVLLAGLLQAGLEDIDFWLQYILGVEIYIATVFFLDIGLICCCSKQPYKYKQLYTVT